MAKKPQLDPGRKSLEEDIERDAQIQLELHENGRSRDVEMDENNDDILY
ncbi:MAG: hypothetical protein SXQ77_07910 [Halobacteria archaeon]|nr:hypothetical protein [Halobacteria archaeon]